MKHARYESPRRSTIASMKQASSPGQGSPALLRRDLSDDGDGGIGRTTMGAGPTSFNMGGLASDNWLLQPVQASDLGDRPRTNADTNLTTSPRNSFAFGNGPDNFALGARVASPAGRAGGFGHGGSGYRGMSGAASSPMLRSPSNGPSDFQDRRSPRQSLGRGGQGHLIVCYFEGERPMDELPRLEGGNGMHVIVAMVTPGSKAARAGVRPGFAVASLNGRAEFMKLPAWQVRQLLESPITIGFDPTPGMRPAQSPAQELRLTANPRIDPLGIPNDQSPWSQSRNGEPPGQAWVVAEEVNFKPTDDYLGNEKGSFSFTPNLTQIYAGAQDRMRALSPVRHCSPERQSRTSETARYRNDRSPLRWLAPVLNQFIDTVCADGSDDMPNADVTDTMHHSDEAPPMNGGVALGKGIAPMLSPRSRQQGTMSPRLSRRLP